MQIIPRASLLSCCFCCCLSNMIACCAVAADGLLYGILCCCSACANLHASYTDELARVGRRGEGEGETLLAMDGRISRGGEQGLKSRAPERDLVSQRTALSQERGVQQRLKRVRRGCGEGVYSVCAWP